MNQLSLAVSLSLFKRFYLSLKIFDHLSMGVFFLSRSRQHFLHNDFVVGEGFVDGSALVVGCRIGLETLENFKIVGLVFKGTDEGPEIVLHVFFNPVVLLNLLLLNILIISQLLLYSCQPFELKLKFSFFDDQIENLRG